MSKPRVVIALGGNALQKDGEVTAEAQKSVAEKIGQIIAKLSAKYEIIVAHGNGPQVGNILIHEETASTATAPAMPLETAVAMSQGQIGYWLSQAIDNAFAREHKRKQVASIVTQVVVDRKIVMIRLSSIHQSQSGNSILPRRQSSWPRLAVGKCARIPVVDIAALFLRRNRLISLSVARLCH